ncbi:hypothetical protein [Herbaspirillum robiniae]|uniref:hypothetical protein n=1 Tax=Herbaspirillum robiniae TaxID=2014887 RepID=UPI0009A22007|nr:hypothetical protein [Herbaspirillum robiniae]
MENVVAAALRIDSGVEEWVVHFTAEKALTGPITRISDDIYRIVVNERHEIYFDAKQVLYMNKRK